MLVTDYVLGCAELGLHATALKVGNCACVGLDSYLASGLKDCDLYILHSSCARRILEWRGVAIDCSCRHSVRKINTKKLFADEVAPLDTCIVNVTCWISVSHEDATMVAG